MKAAKGKDVFVIENARRNVLLLLGHPADFGPRVGLEGVFFAIAERVAIPTAQDENSLLLMIKDNSKIQPLLYHIRLLFNLIIQNVVFPRQLLRFAVDIATNDKYFLFPDSNGNALIRYQFIQLLFRLALLVQIVQVDLELILIKII